MRQACGMVCRRRQILEQEGACLSALHIEDAPAIVNRGYYFDRTRGRIPKLSWLKQLADRMAYYKLKPSYSCT